MYIASYPKSGNTWARLLFLAYTKGDIDINNIDIPFEKVHDIATEIGEGKAIYIIRDPRDVAISLARHTGNDIDTAIQNMNSPYAILSTEGVVSSKVSSWGINVATWLIRPDTLLVKYEDMLEDTHREFKRMLEFMEIDYEEQKTEQAISATQLEELRKQERDNGFIESSDHSTFFGEGGTSWTKVLNDKQVWEIESVYADLMQDLGYVLSKPILMVG